MGIVGAVLATVAGNAVVTLILIPVIVVQARWSLDLKILRSLLVIGLPFFQTFVVGWVLQLADRYLLSLFAPVQEVAIYSVGYALGWIVCNLFVTPFVASWGTRLFMIAKQSDAINIYQQVFGFYSMLSPLFFKRLFPEPYKSAAPVSAIVALASVFNGIYYVFWVGLQLRKKVWLLPIYFGICSVTNVLLNLILIPRLGLTGAALATLACYGLLAILAYLGNQLIYPLPFEVVRFVIAAFIGVGLYFETQWTVMRVDVTWGLPVRVAAILAYGIMLLAFAVSGRGIINGD
jgi:O-antigen/teichoic acid export membrane protein